MTRFAVPFRLCAPPEAQLIRLMQVEEINRGKGLGICDHCWSLSAHLGGGKLVRKKAWDYPPPPLFNGAQGLCLPVRDCWLAAGASIQGGFR